MALTQISTDGIKDGTITGADLATNVDLVDNKKIRFGTGNDLQIYHDGSNSHIAEAGTGVLKISGSAGVYINKHDNTETMAAFLHDAGVELYHNNNKHFETATNGGIFRGTTWTAVDNCKIAFGTGDDLKLYHDATDSYIENTGKLYIKSSNFVDIRSSGNETMIKAIPDGAVELYHNNSKKFETRSGGLGVFGHIEAGDSSKLMLGDSNDLQIYHDGTNSIIKNTYEDLYINCDSDDLYLKAADNIFMQPQAGETGINIYGNGAVELYYDNSRKLATTNTGVRITNHFLGVNVDSASGTFSGRNAHLAMGDTDTGIAQNGDGQLEAWANNQEIMNWDTSEVICFKNFEPNSNNSFDIGSNSKRWRVIYTNNTINNSDKNLKNTIANSDLGLSFINKLRPVSYKWKKIEGENLDTKTHYGLIAQEVETALASEGKTLDNFAGVYKPDDYKEDGTGGAMGLTTSELLSPLIKAIQELSAEVATLKAG